MAEPLEEKHQHKESNQRLERSNPIHQDAIESKSKFRKERINKFYSIKGLAPPHMFNLVQRLRKNRMSFWSPEEKDIYRYTSTRGNSTPSTERKNRENAGTADPGTI